MELNKYSVINNDDNSDSESLDDNEQIEDEDMSDIYTRKVLKI